MCPLLATVALNAPANPAVPPVPFGVAPPVPPSPPAAPATDALTEKGDPAVFPFSPFVPLPFGLPPITPATPFIPPQTTFAAVEIAESVPAAPGVSRLAFPPAFPAVPLWCRVPFTT